ncbi:MAG: aldo/keto reductase [Anaerolineales bacterium]|nr:aldo/keto reductase [Anaerolineales bacterium]
MKNIFGTRRLGRTDLQVTPVGLGVMQFAGATGIWRLIFDEMDTPEMHAIVRAALEGGINWFDTAEIYGRGRSEEGLASGLKAAGKADDEVRIATKWMPLLRTAGNIRKTIGERKRRLAPYSIDLYYVHNATGFSSPEAEMNAMADLVEAGDIRTVGVSNFDEARMRRAHGALAERGIPLAANQMEFSLLNRKIEADGVLDAARELGITIVAYSPLARGLLTGKFHYDPDVLKNTPIGRRLYLQRMIEKTRPLIDALGSIARSHETTAAQVALNWLIQVHGETVVVIPGASSVSQAEEAAAVMGFKLTTDEIDRLDQLSKQYR